MRAYNSHKLAHESTAYDTRPLKKYSTTSAHSLAWAETPAGAEGWGLHMETGNAKCLYNPQVS